MSLKPSVVALGLLAGCVLVACGTSDPAETVSPTAYHMYDHMARTAAVQHAILAGNINAARAPASWLDLHLSPSGMGGQADAYVAQMRTAAGQISSARTLDEAAVHLGEMGTACGACHQAARVQVDFRWLPVPPTNGEIDSHMERHQWALDRLWEGLAGPSEKAWEAGSEVLADPTLPISRTGAEAGRRHRAEAGDLAVHELGAQATRETYPTRRAELFSQLIVTCRDCHELLGANPNP